MTLTPDPHGQAALLLVESLLLLLIEKGMVAPEDMVDAIEGVVEVKREIAGTSEKVVVSMASIGLLRGISGSLRATAPAEPSRTD